MTDPGNEFARLLVRHDRELRRYIATFVPRRDCVEEILQQTAATLWEKFSDFDRNREFVPWAIRFAYFEVLNFRKHQARSRFIFSDEVLSAIEQTHDELASELQHRQMALQGCLEQLPNKDRMLITRRYSDSSTIKSLAVETGRTVKTLYRRLDRIRDSIATCVERKMVSNSQ
ncbi:sigma-70 family RNA polymerase sigma factor [Fuerstiella marisgermanici]|uniref:RNA polymerase sigma factor CnrH n=1 Tax=Fuerstiella marisgermanici TaxID=1891926 RepID=A0A1P8WGH9_9PLAN|nr:sigma-70 family RNA polymerase sigma factor [Fuerstiella marisgermanici]APZ93142.1 RNA polymerase sigma factor CnrH [Fuerstiella marisgermanici]